MTQEQKEKLKKEKDRIRKVVDEMYPEESEENKKKIAEQAFRNMNRGVIA